MKWKSPDKPPIEYEEVLLRRDKDDKKRPIIESGYYVAPMFHDDGTVAFPADWESALSMEYERWNEIAGYFNGKPRELPPVTGWMPLPDNEDE